MEEDDPEEAPDAAPDGDQSGRDGETDPERAPTSGSTPPDSDASEGPLDTDRGTDAAGTDDAAGSEVGPDPGSTTGDRDGTPKAASGDEHRERFEDVDWEELDGDVGLVSRRTAVYLVGIGTLAALFLYDYFLLGPQESIYWTNWPSFRVLWWPVFGFKVDPRGVDWLYYASMLTFVAYGVVPLLVRRDRTLAYWRELSESKLAVLSLLVVVAFVVLGIAGPQLFPSDLNVLHETQPPPGFSVDRFTTEDCATGWQNGVCHGSMRYPFGTNGLGRGVLRLIVSGIGVAFKVALISTMIAIPIAVAVGTTAGYYGGLVDDLLMRYVDVQQTVPAFLVYLILRFLFTQSLFLIVLVFGLFSWGGAARLVRSEVVGRREELYVTAARSAGASPWYVIRRHVVPNVSHTVFFSATRLAATLVLIETGISFLELNDPVLHSFGETIDNGLQEPFPAAWWISTLPAVTLAAIIASLNVLGDALRDALDPRDPV